MNRILYSPVYFHRGGRCMTLIMRIYAKCTLYNIKEQNINVNLYGY